MRTAISPRLAMRTVSNTAWLGAGDPRGRHAIAERGEPRLALLALARLGDLLRRGHAVGLPRLVRRLADHALDAGLGVGTGGEHLLANAHDHGVELLEAA